MSNLTIIAGVPSKSDAKPGMAHFAGTGPNGKRCGECIFRGYFRNPNDIRKYYGCLKFKKLTGRNGPAVEADWRSCKYFEPKLGDHDNYDRSILESRQPPVPLASIGSPMSLTTPSSLAT